MSFDLTTFFTNYDVFKCIFAMYMVFASRSNFRSSEILAIVGLTELSYA